MSHTLGKYLRSDEEPWWPNIRRLVIIWGTQLINQRPRKGSNYFTAELSIPENLPEDPFLHEWVIKAIEIGISGSQELTSTLIKKDSDTTVMISVVA